MVDQVRLDQVGDLITALTTEHVTAFMSADGESGHATVMKIIEAVLTYLGAPVIMEGDWDASVGTFPGGGEAKKGWSYIVTTAGTVDGVDFNVNDRLIAKANNASATTYEDNWFKADYTDQVLSVAGLTGAISASALAAALTMLMPKAGGAFTGSFSVSAGASSYIALSKSASGGYTYLSGQTNNKNRWQLYLGDAVAESGANAGSNFGVYRYADDGTPIAQTLTIYRKTGGWSLEGATGGDPGTGKINAVDYQINGVSVADALVARAKIADLASTDPGEGSATVGVEPIGGLPGVTNVQDALVALYGAIGGSTAFTKSFDSGEQTITSAGLLTLPHGLGAKPKFATAALVCKTAEAGITVGQEVAFDNLLSMGSAIQGCYTRTDATNIIVQFGKNSSVFRVLDSTGDFVNLTNGNFKLVVRAWA